MIRCIAYLEDGRICGQPAYIVDVERGGMVCAEHHREGLSEDLAEATITLRIKTQAALIEHQLALKKIFLDRAGRCLPQCYPHETTPHGTAPHRASHSDKCEVAEPGGEFVEAPQTQGRRQSANDFGIRVSNESARKDAGPGQFAPGNSATLNGLTPNPIAAAFDQVHVFEGGRW